MNTAPHAPNSSTSTNAENKMSVRQLLDDQEYPVAKGGIIKKAFDSKADVEQCMAYIHSLYQLHGCPRYNSDIITSCTCLKILLINNNAMLGAV